jgi:tape measure domain-containing protein
MSDFSVKAVLSAVDKNFSSTMKEALGSAGSLRSQLSSGLGFGILSGIGQQAFTSITNGITSMMSEMSSAGSTWQTFTANMQMNGKSADEIARTKNELQKFAEQTIYSSSDMASTFAQLDAVGTKDTLELVKGFGGLAAAANDPKQAMKTLSQQATQMAAKPKVAWEDFKLILEQTPAGVAAIAKTMGMSTQDLIKNVQDGTLATQDFFDAIEKTGTNTAFTKLATQYKTVGDAMDGLKETVSNKLSPVFDTFSKSAISGIGGIIDKLSSMDFTTYANIIQGGINQLSGPFSDAAKAVSDALGQMNGHFGDTQNLTGFAGAVDGVVSVLKGFAGFVKDHADQIAWLISNLPKLAAAFVGFKILKSIVPFQAAFAKAISDLAAKGIEGLATKLFATAAGETAAGTASEESAGSVMSAAVSFLALGAGILLACVGVALLAQSAIALTSAGLPAIVMMVALVAIVVVMAAVLAYLGPVLTLCAVGILAFGVAMALLGVGALAAGAGILLVSMALPNIVQYGLAGAGAIVLLSAAMLVFAVGASVAGVACIVLAAGLIVLGVGLIAAGAGALIAAVGFAALAVAVLGVGVGLAISAASIVVMAALLPLVAAGALLSAAGLTLLSAASMAMVIASAALIVAFAALLVPLAGFTGAMWAAAAGAGALALALGSVQGSVNDIANKAMTAASALTMMVGAVDVVNTGLDALGGIAQSAMSNMEAAFNGATGNVIQAGAAMMSGYAAAISSGGNQSVSIAIAISAAVASALGSAAGSAYNDGYQIGAGLANGMYSSLGEVSAAADAMVAEVDRAIRAKAQINSPARMTTKLGRYLGLGLPKGIRTTFGEIKKASQQMVNIPAAAATGGGYNGNYQLNDNYSYTPTVYVDAQVKSIMDGREVGYGSARYVQEKNDFDTTRKARLGGNA